jgi:cobalt-zinc-cadmium efflux system protein
MTPPSHGQPRHAPSRAAPDDGAGARSAHPPAAAGDQPRHDHHHAPPSERGFALGVALNLGYVAVEAAAGFWAGSLALIADAGHNLSDVLGLLLAWGAARLARRAPTRRRSYGWRRASILAALANAMLLLVAVGAIGFEAIGRLRDPAPVATDVVLWVAAVGVAVNTGTALLFLRGREHDLNRQGAFLHMLADAAVTLGVIIAALLIAATGWHWLDPAVALAIGAVILVGTWSLLRDSANLAMDAAPRHIDPAEVEAWLAALPGVASVHDLHIWAMSTTETALTAHLVRPRAEAPDDAFLAEAARGLRARFGIGHVTLQVERGDAAHPCMLAPAEVV